MRKVLSFALVLLTVFALVGCTTSTSKEESNFRLLISDAPADIADFEYLNVTIDSMRLFTDQGDFEEREIDVTVDLTQLVGALSTEVLETEIAPGTYTKVELHVAKVDAQTVSGEEAYITVPSNKLQINNTFEISEDEVTTFVFDINIVRKGQGQEYNLLPVISESGVVGKDLDDDEVEEVEPDPEPEEELEE